MSSDVELVRQLGLRVMSDSYPILLEDGFVSRLGSSSIFD